MPVVTTITRPLGGRWAHSFQQREVSWDLFAARRSTTLPRGPEHSLQVSVKETSNLDNL